MFERRVTCVSAIACILPCVVGCVSVEDQVPSSLTRSASGRYLLSAQIETYGTTPTEVVAAVGASEFPMTDRGGGRWEASATLGRCLQGFQLRYLVRHPAAVGSGTDTYVEPPGATATLGGLLKRISGTTKLPDCTPTTVYRVNDNDYYLPDADPTDGICNTSPAGSGKPVCTLRAAIDQANAQPGPATIEVPAGTYGAIDYFTPRDDLTIVGIEPGVILREHVSIYYNPSSPPPTVELRNLTLLGGVRCDGSLRLVSVRVLNSHPFAVDAGVMALGTLSIEDSTITGNGTVGVRLRGEHGRIVNSLIADNGIDGGIECAPMSGMTSELTISNSTLTGNRGRLGALHLLDRCSATVRNSTIASNELTRPAPPWLSHTAGGVTLDAGASLTLANTILADNVNPFDPANSDCAFASTGTITVQSLGSNVIQSSTSCTFNEALSRPDVHGSSAQLGALADNGGPTQTLLPSPSSPALGIGSPDAVSHANIAACLPTDQRGFARASGCDVGAVEVP
jgi:hypothetical protein